ncbi:MAG: type I DNA topoisomerase [Clostridiales bacterium]|nr:type I DNA topoisomerase [Candidatus Crickella caballi]
MAQAKKKTTDNSNKTLLIVESPSKAKVIGGYLGRNYKVIASVGHVKDLPKSRLGVDVEDDFRPDYIKIRGKAETIKSIIKEAATAKKVLLATDPDREGEAISWHLADLLGINPETECRITFNEINKNAVLEAIKQPRAIDESLFDAQQARRVLDRLVGYQISPLLWKKVAKNLSAGRVQSAALKMICDREKEIMNFVPEEYWTITADFGNEFLAELSKISGKKAAIGNADEAYRIEVELGEGSYTVKEVKEGHKKIKPFAPFTTSSMQQDASVKLGFATSKTMSVAQNLYEGINIKGIGTRGLITYLRTDSVRVSDQAKASARAFIGEKFGKNYVGNSVFSNKNKAMQDAHEAIRPADVTLDPDTIKDSLTADQYKLYKLIWDRFVASQMAPAEYDTVAVLIENGKYEFKSTGSRMTFDGWRKVYPVKEEKENKIPLIKEGDELELEKLIKEQKFTQPPSRFTEASLVKEMEEKNIGRPSTYASIISVLITRKYVKREKKVLVPTKLGFDVTGILQDYFEEIVDVEFTGKMEDNLDNIELGKIYWKEVIRDFYKNFKPELERADAEVQRIEKEVILSDEVCELCGRPMAVKEGHFGTFLACTGYPECKNTKAIVKSTGVKCPSCGKDIIERRSRKGKIFYGCSGYPDCTVSYWDKPTGEFCPKCGAMMVQSKGKTKLKKCSDKECGYKEK